MLDELLTENEAASITGVPPRQIDRMIEAGWLDGLLTARDSVRFIPRSALVGLTLAHATAGVLTDESRRAVVAALVKEPTVSSVRSSETVSVDTTSAVEAVRVGLDTLTRAQDLVKVDPAIMGGAPVIDGTRIPVHQIAAMHQNGDSIASLVGAFPTLDSRMVTLAIVYAQAYPVEALRADEASIEEIRLKLRHVASLDDLS